ncbi:MAG: GNAT family N-acetyltransferase [Phycisphaerae bacterium]|nr:GNAT family N-acetyltransferase [Phycisphaerae bacterium]
MSNQEMDAVTTSLTIPNRLTYLRPVMAYVREIAALVGLSEKDRYDVELAVEEALANVIEHGFEPDALATFELACEVAATSVSFVIHEKGMPYDPNRVRDYQPPASLSEATTEGLGMFLIKRMMDEVSFRNLGRQGRQTRLTKRLAAKRVDGLVEPERLSPYAKTPRDTKRSDSSPDYTVRPLRQDEALEVSVCAYKAYGYSYEDYIYYPERIWELNQKGLLSSFVAVAEDGTLMGHAALKRNATDDVIGEYGVLFVKPEYRGASIAGRLTEALAARAETLNLCGVFARAVTSHVVSQKLAAAHGLRDTAILLGALPSDVEFKSLAGLNKRRESGLVCYRPIRRGEPRDVFPPPRHAHVIERLYENAGISVNTRDGGSNDKPRQCELHTRKIAMLNTGMIEVSAAGDDCMAEIKRAWRSLCLDKTDAIYAHLDLEDPATPAICSGLEDIGFFLAGILPDGLRGRDALILQYLNNLRIDFDRIKLHSTAANELLDYIRQLEPSAKE